MRKIIFNKYMNMCVCHILSIFMGLFNIYLFNNYL